MLTKQFHALVEELHELYLDGEYHSFVTKWTKTFERLTVHQQLSLRRRLLSEWRSPQVWKQLL